MRQDGEREIIFKSRKGTVIEHTVEYHNSKKVNKFLVFPITNDIWFYSISEPEHKLIIYPGLYKINEIFKKLMSYKDKQAWRWFIRKVRDLDIGNGKTVKDFLIGGTILNEASLLKYEEQLKGNGD